MGSRFKLEIAPMHKNAYKEFSSKDGSKNALCKLLKLCQLMTIDANQTKFDKLFLNFLQIKQRNKIYFFK